MLKNTGEINNLYCRRQYLMSSKVCTQLENWCRNTIGQYNLYSHPDTEVTLLKSESDKVELALVGYLISPTNPNKSNRDILENISRDISINSISEKLYKYAGRYVLIIKINDNYLVFHDACGLRLVFYTQFENQHFLASQPLLLKLLVPLKEGDRFKKYQESKYKKGNIEHWIPSGCSLFENVYQLVPNHYLDLSNSKQNRYWPQKALSKISLEVGVKKASELLKNILIAFSMRYKLALPLTAGWDSRTILSACRSIADSLFFYTLKYRDLKADSTDIKIPQKLLTELGYSHDVIDCNIPIDNDFAKVYQGNSDISHLDDWGRIANGMLVSYPTDRAFIKGNCAEIARCFYYHSGNHPAVKSADDLLKLEPGWDEIPFIKEQVTTWCSDTSKNTVNCGYDLLDLFYWEHRMGSWQAQSQLEWDIVQESITPFNNRELLDILLSVDVKFRRKPDYQLFKKIIETLWKETLLVPINPKSTFHKINVLKNIILARLRAI